MRLDDLYYLSHAKQSEDQAAGHQPAEFAHFPASISVSANRAVSCKQPLCQIRQVDTIQTSHVSLLRRFMPHLGCLTANVVRLSVSPERITRHVLCATRARGGVQFPCQTWQVVVLAINPADANIGRKRTIVLSQKCVARHLRAIKGAANQFGRRHFHYPQ